MTSETIHVGYSLTRNLYPQLQVTIRSLLEHNDDLMVHIMAEDDELPFEIPCMHEILNMSEQRYFPMSNPNCKSQFSYMAMLRVAWPDMVAEDRLIQLDVDTIVCGSLRPAWEINLTGKWIAWCPEYNGQFRPFGPMYYNFGVAVLNLSQLHLDNAPEFMVRELNRFQYPFLDQDVMNRFAVPDKTVNLPVRFNECFCCGQTDNPAIVHYAGWPDWFTNPNIPRRKYLEKYLERG